MDERVRLSNIDLLMDTFSSQNITKNTGIDVNARVMRFAPYPESDHGRSGCMNKVKGPDPNDNDSAHRNATSVLKSIPRRSDGGNQIMDMANS
jgi:hypothetical protein